MSKDDKLNIIWLLLMAITLINGLIAESGGSGVFVVIFVAASVSFKGQMIVDYFMGLKGENRHLRRWMKIYLYVIPWLVVIVFVFPDFVAELIRLN